VLGVITQSWDETSLSHRQGHALGKKIGDDLPYNEKL